MPALDRSRVLGRRLVNDKLLAERPKGSRPGVHVASPRAGLAHLHRSAERPASNRSSVHCAAAPAAASSERCCWAQARCSKNQESPARMPSQVSQRTSSKPEAPSPNNALQRSARSINCLARGRAAEPDAEPARWTGHQAAAELERWAARSSPPKVSEEKTP